jgi:catechol 2,3-dioxygenase-like lactoylglutathione lyase family enzyme
MRISVTSVLVDDQEKALRLYSDVLGFVRKRDIPLGEARWLTVVSPDEPDGTELLLSRTSTRRRSRSRRRSSAMGSRSRRSRWRT